MKTVQYARIVKEQKRAKIENIIWLTVRFIITK